MVKPSRANGPILAENVPREGLAMLSVTMLECR